MVVRGIMSPTRSRSTTKERKPSNNNNHPTSKSDSKKPNELNRSKRKEKQSTAINNPPTTKTNNNDTISSKSTSKIVATSINPNAHKKLLDNDSTTKLSRRLSKSTKPSSPARTATKPISQQIRLSPTKSNLKGGIAVGSSGSKSKLYSAAAKPTALPKAKSFASPNESASPCSTGQSASTLHDLDVRDQLQRFSIHAKDLSSIILQANSIHGSDTKDDGGSSQSKDSRMFQIYKKIASHRQENSSITSYFTKLKELWDELATLNTHLPQCSCGGARENLSEHREREKVMQFLVGLNDSYSTICNQILLTNPFPTVENAYSSIVKEEKRRELIAVLRTVAEKVILNNLFDLQNQNAH